MAFDWHVLLRYAPQLLDGFATTLMAVAMSLAAAILLGLTSCVGSLAKHPMPRAMARTYTNVFRVVPDIVLIFWMYYCFPLVFGIKLSGLASGVIALSLTTGAFLGEVFRAGIGTVPVGQVEAARALGLRPLPVWLKIILPQAIRRMAPAFINTFSELLKHTTLLAGIGVAELTYSAYTLGARTFKQLEFLSVVAVAYFVIIFPLSMAARHAERRLQRRTGH